MGNLLFVVFELHLKLLLVELVLLVVVIIDVDCLLHRERVSEEVLPQIELHQLEKGKRGVRLDLHFWLRNLLLLLHLFHLNLRTV